MIQSVLSLGSSDGYKGISTLELTWDSPLLPSMDPGSAIDDSEHESAISSTRAPVTQPKDFALLPQLTLSLLR